MKKLGSNPTTLTEAQLRSGVSVVLLARNVTHSNSRTIPYSETYRGRTSLMETPVQYLQKAAEDEKRRQPVH